MRIALVSTIDDYPWGGADTLWTHAARAAGARGDTLFVAVSQRVAEHDHTVALKAQVFVRRPPRVPVSLVERLRAKARRLASYADPLFPALDRFNPDLLILSLGGTYDLARSPEWCRWLGQTRAPFRIIANCQDEHPVLDGAGLQRARALFPRAEKIYFVSNRNMAVTRGHLGLDLGNASVIQNPLRWRTADTPPWPSEEVLSLAAVARLEPVKGIHILLPALEKALGREAGWRLQVFGRGPDEARLRALSDELGLSGRVHFQGYVRDLRDIWAGNHILLSPAVEDGVPMTIPEAMLCGRPVLATQVGGAADWITPGSSGFICPSSRVEDLGGTLRLAWDARGQWREMGRRAVQQAHSLYRADDFLSLIAAVPVRS